MTAITIMLGCRMGGSDTCRLRQCLTSLIDNATDVGNFEILVKCDNDDPALDEIIHTLHQLGCRANIRCIVTPRGLGYTDLHKAYLDLLRIANPTSELYWVISDDIEMQTPGWDNKMLAAVSRHADAPFVLITKEFDHTSMRDAAERCDPYPVWSRCWLGLQGGFGYTFSTDGWTSMLCYLLRGTYSCEIRVYVDVKINRFMGPGDAKDAARWTGIRKETIDLMLTPQMQTLLHSTARALICYVKQQGGFTGELPPPHPRVLDTIPLVELVKAVGVRLWKRILRK